MPRSFLINRNEEKNSQESHRKHHQERAEEPRHLGCGRDRVSSRDEAKAAAATTSVTESSARKIRGDVSTTLTSFRSAAAAKTVDDSGDEAAAGIDDGENGTDSGDLTAEETPTPTSSPLLFRPPPSTSSSSPSAPLKDQHEGEGPIKKVVCGDHDYLELLVKVKEEAPDDVEEVDVEQQPLVGIKPEPPRHLLFNGGNVPHPSSPSSFFNLSQLAEVSLAMEGRSEDARLTQQVRAAMAAKTMLPKVPLPPAAVGASSGVGKRTMQIVLPDNASHIIICTNNNGVAGRLELGGERPAAAGTVSKKHEGTPSNGKSSINKVTAPVEGEGHICSDCGKRYSTSSNLARHKQTHRSLTDKKAKKCPFCSKIYVSMPAYSMHLRTHNQTCKCDICGKRFSRPWLLQGHIRTHTGERPFPCHLCPKAFADKSNLRAHVQTHSNSKPYSCKKCGKTFALKSYLYKHEEAACGTKLKS